jgi:hypothetical protein
MVSQPVPGLTAAVECFLAHFRQLQYLPFISEVEIGELYGQEVNAALKMLDLYNQEKHICAKCQYRCCRRVKCELYDTALAGCPVELYRPVLCRVHYCDRFSAHHDLVKTLGDIYLESLLEAAKLDASRAAFFDCPSFTPLAPDLTASMVALLKLGKENQQKQSEVLLQIGHLIENRSSLFPENKH